MTLRILPLLAVLLLSACMGTLPPRPSSKLELIDLVDDFAAFQQGSEGMEDKARIEAFKAHFATILPGFYSNERVRFPGYDVLILKSLKEYPQQRAAIEDMARRFRSQLTPAERSFEAQFGPMSGFRPIVLVHSLGEFDGGTRSLPGGGHLMFGADVMARIYAAKNPQPFFHHELFHLYHGRTFDDCSAVWCNLWNEGLATYVSHRMNPQATDNELLLETPSPLRAAVEANRREAVCAALARMDSTDGKDNNALFSSGRLSDTLPPRSGYYIGYLIAAEAGRSRSLKELAQLSNDQVRPLVEATLRGMASCG
ncbi:MAG TPA: hypothetical protein VF582_08640 [Allosphingosinicella sp.]|jgi:hypothetical protein